MSSSVHQSRVYGTEISHLYLCDFATTSRLDNIVLADLRCKTKFTIGFQFYLFAESIPMLVPQYCHSFLEAFISTDSSINNVKFCSLTSAFNIKSLLKNYTAECVIVDNYKKKLTLKDDIRYETGCSTIRSACKSNNLEWTELCMCKCNACSC